MKRYIKSSTDIHYNFLDNIVETVLGSHAALLTTEYNLVQQNEVIIADDFGDPTDALNRELEVAGYTDRLVLKKKKGHKYYYTVK